MDALIIVNLILNVFIFIALGFAIFLLNKKIVQDAERAKRFSDGLAKLDKHFKIGEQLLAKKLKENEENIKRLNQFSSNKVSEEIKEINSLLNDVSEDVKDLSKYEELK